MPGLAAKACKKHKKKTLDKIYYNGEIFKNKLNKLIKHNLKLLFNGHPQELF